MNRKRVLVVDDDESSAKMLSRFLQRDYDVTLAFDGLQGLERAIATRPDLVIADVWMPVMDGIEMIEALKGDPNLHRVPVIFLTALSDAPHVALAITAGARHFLPKPIQADKLLVLVKRSLH